MSNDSISTLAKEFLRTYDAATMDALWEQQQETFRSFWTNRVLISTSAALSEDECDAIIRILDRNAKGNTKDTEAVARVMGITQRGWRKLFNEFRANQKLAELITRIFEEVDSNQKAV